MINLTPINKQIQQRMFEKMDALEKHKAGPNEAANSTEKLTFDNLATRSTFIKMVSNQANPITIMGGLLKPDGEMYLGQDMYSPRSYGTNTSTAEVYKGTAEQNTKLEERMGADYRDTAGNSIPFEKRKNAFDEYFPPTSRLVNSNSRPIPGIKSIDVTFKGGSRALREATINWTCWDWEELDELMPHFLAHGKNVLLEWGWVYGKKSITDLPSLADFTGKISDAAFKDFSHVVMQGKGDFDFMMGKVSNFEFTTRADGGFNCTTTLTSIGVNIFDNPTPNSKVLDPGVQYKLSRRQELEDVAELLTAVTDNTDDEYIKGDATTEVLSVDTNISLKLFIKEIDKYVREQLSADGTKYSIAPLADDAYHSTGTAFWKDNQFIAKGNYVEGDNTSIKNYEIENVWVQWGWFEDNVLDKFLSMTNGKGERITQFRSIENVINDSGFSQTENVRIRNHPLLETTDINNHILPNQFYPQEKTQKEIKGKKYDISGDKKILQVLAKAIAADFKPFSANQTVGKGFDWEADYYEAKEKYGDRVSMDTPQMIIEDYDGPPIEEPALGEEAIYSREDKKPGEYGYLRHILVNTKIIKEAFGIQDGEDLSIESLNIIETLDYMFDLLNQDLDFWDFEITTDSTVTNRAKIIDDSVTNFDFKKVDRDLGVVEKRTMVMDDGKINEANYDLGGNVFFFPTWHPGSFVKSQNITANIPSELQLTTMYGSNMDSVKESTNPGNNYSDKSGVAAGALYNEDIDTHSDGIDIAFRNELAGVVAKVSDNLNPPSLVNVDTSVTEFIQGNTDLLEEGYEKRLAQINKDIGAAAEASRKQELFEGYDPAQGLPPPQYLNDKDYETLLKYEIEEEEEQNFFEGLFAEDGKLTAALNSKFDEDGRMKEDFISFIGYQTTEANIPGVAEPVAKRDRPIKVPFDLSIDIDGTGGIYPGNSFHSQYLPTRYQKYAIFQAFDISHKVDGSGWTTSIGGKMRTTMKIVISPIPETNIADAATQQVNAAIGNLGKIATIQAEKRAAEKAKQEAKDKEDTRRRMISHGIMTGGCWIAAELYGGWYKPRTILARKFVNSSKFPKILFNLYMKYGKQTARFIKKYKFMKLILKPIFDIFVTKGRKI